MFHLPTEVTSHKWTACAGPQLYQVLKINQKSLRNKFIFGGFGVDVDFDLIYIKIALN
jgi:hypothetical protein